MSAAGPVRPGGGPLGEPAGDTAGAAAEQPLTRDEWIALDAERRRRAERAMRGVFAATLCLEALMVILVPRAVAWSGAGLTTVRLVVLVGLAALLVATAGQLRRRWGLTVGTLLQVGILACGLLTTAMVVLGAVFGLIWIYELRSRAELLTPRPPPA